MSKAKPQKHQKHQPRAQSHQSGGTVARHQAQRERGGLLTAAIIIVIIHGLLMTAAAYYDLTTNGIEVKSLYMPILFLTSAADVIAGIAMWLWKKWGFQLYVAASLVAATAALMNTGSILVLFAGILPLIIVAYIYVPRQNSFD